MSKKDNFYEKDNWLHGWAGGDISFLDLDILKKIATAYYPFSLKQSKIFLNKYGFNVTVSLEKWESVAHDISLNAIFEMSKMITLEKYDEQGKMEQYLGRIIQWKVLRFMKHKAKHENHDDLEKLGMTETTSNLTDEKSLEEYMQECEEEIMNSDIFHYANNLKLLYKQKHEDKSIEELADVEQTSAGGIKSRLRSARKLLEECIKSKRDN
jgi:DNA-directed RNA polymerase specialized sigma24 family protein